MTIKWLSSKAVIAIHAALIEEHSGLQGAINHASLESTLARPQQFLSYPGLTPDIFSLAAAYAYEFAKNHCFTDGNKRVALSSIDNFLILNGFELVASEVEAVAAIIQLAAGEMSEVDLIEWIRQNHRQLED
ncbi:MAG: death-on-curing protein [Planctomycetota bacterium]